MYWILKKDYATPFCAVPAGTIGKADGGYFCFANGEESFSFPEEDVRECTEWFEETKEHEYLLVCAGGDCGYRCVKCKKVKPSCKKPCCEEPCIDEEPKSQEGKCGNEGCLGIHTTTCSQFLFEGAEIDMVSKKPQEKEECKQEQLKPSEWIQRRSVELYKRSKERDAIQMSWEASDKQAALDFLDSVEEGKYKL